KLIGVSASSDSSFSACSVKPRRFNKLVKGSTALSCSSVNILSLTTTARSASENATPNIANENCNVSQKIEVENSTPSLGIPWDVKAVRTKNCAVNAASNQKSNFSVKMPRRNESRFSKV